MLIFSITLGILDFWEGIDLEHSLRGELEDQTPNMTHTSINIYL